jgi:NAD(P)-dependent dehydrogenase (short-subunit alcohol dehydrogenase family)
MDVALHNAFGLAGRVCVVTGAGNGIGRGIAAALAKEGAKIAILDLNEVSANETLKQVSALGADALAVKCDTSDLESVEAARAAVHQKFGDADVLVNNAGIAIRSPLATISLPDWNKVLSVNLTGYLICSQVFGRAMLERKNGVIVHIASVTAEETAPGLGSYGVAKAGVTMLSRLLAVEWGPSGVRSNAIHPGFIQTAIAQEAYENPAIAKARAEAAPIGRYGQPDDIAQAVMFLAGPRSSFANGAELMVDGGFSRNIFNLYSRTI